MKHIYTPRYNTKEEFEKLFPDAVLFLSFHGMYEKYSVVFEHYYMLRGHFVSLTLYGLSAKTLYFCQVEYENEKDFMSKIENDFAGAESDVGRYFELAEWVMNMH